MSTIHTLKLPATPLDEAALRLLADDNPAGMVVHRRHKPLYVNKAWAETHGLSADDVMGLTSLLGLLAPEERNRMQTFTADRLAGLGAPDRYTYQGLHHSGRRIWIDALVKLVNWQGEPAVLNTIVKVDLERNPERIAVMERVLRAHQLHLAVLSQVQDRISVIDANYRYRFTNQRNMDFYGLTLHDFIGKPVLEIIGAERFARARPNFDRVLRGGAVNYVHDITLGNDETGWVDVSMRPFLSDGGRINGIVVTIRDITELHRAGDALARSEARLQSLLEHTPAMVYLKDDDGRYQVVGRAFAERYGLRRDEMLGRSTHELFPELSAAGFEEHDEQVRQRRGPVDREIVFAGDGGRRVFHALKFPLLDDAGETIGIGGIEMDVTENRRAQSALEESERRLSTLMSNLPGLAYRSTVTSDRCHTDFLSEGCAELTGYPPEEAYAMEQGFLIAITHPDDLERTRQLSDEARRSGRPFQMRYRIVTRAGEVRWVWEHARATPLRDDAFMMEGFISDISESQQLSERLEHQARHDPLTDLLNRRAFEELLDDVVARTRDAGREAALLYLDLDRFKVVNDACGHAAGDELLRQITACMRAEVRQRDVLARLGGDEFALLLEHCPMDQAVQVAEKLRLGVQDFRFVWQEQAFSVGASIGLVPITPECGNASELLVRADNACYAAKDRGRDRVYVYREGDEGADRVSGQTRWLGRIENALHEDALVLLADAIVPTAQPHAGADHYEVLLRMPDEDGGLVPPGGFMPVAERYGLAGTIDRWVVTQVLQRLADNASSERMSINISARSIGDRSFPEFVRKALERTGVDGAQLGFEVTETLAITILSSARDFTESLHRQGCVFCLDEFGSGLSSFNYLKALPVDYVKIDGRFLRGVSDHRVDRAMLRSITDVGRVLHKKVIATAVHDRAVLRRIQRLGVDLVQGLAVATPIPLDELGQAEPTTRPRIPPPGNEFR